MAPVSEEGRSVVWSSGPPRSWDHRRCLWAAELQDLAGTYQAETLLECLRLTDHDIVAALRALQFQSPSLKEDQALEVMAAIRQEVAANPTKYSRSS